MSPWSLRPDRSLRSSRRCACVASLLCTCRRTPSVGRRPDGGTRSDTRPRCAPPCRMRPATCPPTSERSEEHTSELQSRSDLVCRLLLEKKKRAHPHHLRPLTHGSATRRQFI